MDRKPINLAKKFEQFSEHWSPRIIAQMNDHQFKLVKFKGEFVAMPTVTPMRSSSFLMAR